MDASPVLFEVKNTRDSEEPVSAMEQVFAALGAGHGSGTRKEFLILNF